MKRPTPGFVMRALLLLVFPIAAFGCPWEPTNCGTVNQPRVVDLNGNVVAFGTSDSGAPLGNHLAQEQCDTVCGVGEECVSTTLRNGDPGLVCTPHVQCF